MHAYRHYRDLSKMLLCTTMLSSAAVPTALYAAGPDAVNPFRAASKAVRSLTTDQQRELAGALRKGERALIALAYDNTYRQPGLRDPIVRHVSRLAPAALRDVTTAADLGVLTSGQPMTLAPNAAQVLATRSIGASGIGASAYQAASSPANVPLAVAGLPTPYQQTWNLDLIQAQAAYNRGFTGQGVTVAVGDSGFDVTNAALVNKMNIALGRNYLVQAGGTYNPAELTPQVATETDTHGSHVSGIIAAAKVAGVDMHGVAYDSNIIPIRTIIAPGANYGYGPGIDPNAAPLDYFASLSNVMIYNASYGPNAPDAPQTVWSLGTGPTETEARAVLNVLKAGKIIVAATCNDRREHPIAGRNPSGMALYPYIQPAHAATGVYDDGGTGLDLALYQQQAGLIIGVMSVGSTKAPAW